MKLNNSISDADYQLAVVNFRQTLYSALADVDNALSARSQYRQQGERLTQAPCWRRGRKSCTSCAIRRCGTTERLAGCARNAPYRRGKPAGKPL
jgi:hypothetical protein